MDWCWKRPQLDDWTLLKWWRFSFNFIKPGGLLQFFPPSLFYLTQHAFHQSCYCRGLLNGNLLMLPCHYTTPSLWFLISVGMCVAPSLYCPVPLAPCLCLEYVSVVPSVYSPVPLVPHLCWNMSASLYCPIPSVPHLLEHVCVALYCPKQHRAGARKSWGKTQSNIELGQEGPGAQKKGAQAM